MCGHFLLKLQSGFYSSIEECQMRGNNLFKIAQTRITGLTHWQIYVFSAYIFSYISFSKGCSSVAIETISSLFSLPQALFWGITTAASQATLSVSHAQERPRENSKAEHLQPHNAQLLVAEILPLFYPQSWCVIGRIKLQPPSTWKCGRSSRLPHLPGCFFII